MTSQKVKMTGQKVKMTGQKVKKSESQKVNDRFDFRWLKSKSHFDFDFLTFWLFWPVILTFWPVILTFWPVILTFWPVVWLFDQLYWYQMNAWSKRLPLPPPTQSHSMYYPPIRHNFFKSGRMGLVSKGSFKNKINEKFTDQWHGHRGWIYRLLLPESNPRNSESMPCHSLNE